MGSCIISVDWKGSLEASVKMQSPLALVRMGVMLAWVGLGQGLD